jgi:hypothetical protein
MLLQTWYALCNGHPGRWLNGLALFLACAGAWLLLATRQREQAQGAWMVGAAGKPVANTADQPGQRLNRFFYRFAATCMACALLLSWGSTQLG